MAQSSALLLVFLAASAGCHRERVPTLPPLPGGAKILAFGDSLTFGTGVNPPDSYPSQLEAIIHHPVVNAGVPGDTTADGLARLEAALDDDAPALVILCLGGNDMLRQESRATLRANLAAMIETIRARKLSLVLVGVPEPKILSLHAEPVYAELAQQYGLPIENEVLADVLGDRDLKSDQIHANEKGYRLVAEKIAALLKKAGAV